MILDGLICGFKSTAPFYIHRKSSVGYEMSLGFEERTAVILCGLDLPVCFFVLFRFLFCFSWKILPCS